MTIGAFSANLGGNGSIISNAIQVTVAQLQAIVAANTVQVGAWYEITNATAANGGSGSVYVQGIDSNLVSELGYWQYTTAFKSFAWIDLSGTMIAGDTVTSVTVNAVNQLSGSVAFATTYNALAIAIASNINANVSAGYTAVSIQNRVILTNKLVGANNGLAIAAVGTNLVSSNAINTTGGQAAQVLILPCVYRLSSNQIYYVQEPAKGLTYNSSDAVIASLTYNPVYTFPFGYSTSAFDNSQWNGQTFLNLYFTGCVFSNSRFEYGFVINCGSGAAINNLMLEFGDYIKGTIEVTGSIWSYTGGNMVSFIRCTMSNDSGLIATNSKLGGNSIFGGRVWNDFIINITNSTFLPTANCNFSCESLAFINIDTCTINRAISIVGDKFMFVNITNITLNNTISIAINGNNNTVNYVNSVLSGNQTINVVSNDCVIDFTNATIRTASITGAFQGGGIDLASCTLLDYTHTNVFMQQFVIDGNNQNFGANSIQFINCTLINNSIIIPNLGRLFSLNRAVFNAQQYSISGFVQNINGTANNGAINSPIRLCIVPQNFIAVVRLFQFANLPVGLSELEGRFETSGAANSLMLQTLGTTLNNTVQGQTSAIIPAVQGATANFKTTQVDSVVIIPRIAAIASGSIFFEIVGTVTQL